ncbi:hypothetical protein U1Q18_011091 [Sarracenia purpurea var. burkii]
MSSSGQLDLPPGFRFHPTDEELVMHYLCRRCAAQPIAVPIIAEIDLYKFDPWQLPGMALYGEKECSGQVTLPEFTSEKEVQTLSSGGHVHVQLETILAVRSNSLLSSPPKNIR